jgi:hypothetical protein
MATGLLNAAAVAAISSELPMKLTPLSVLIGRMWKSI